MSCGACAIAADDALATCRYAVINGVCQDAPGASAWPRPGAVISCAPVDDATKPPAVVSLQVCSSAPCTTRQGAVSANAFSARPWPLPAVEVRPRMGQSGIAVGSSEQKPRLTAPAKVPAGACASSA